MDLKSLIAESLSPQYGPEVSNDYAKGSRINETDYAIRVALTDLELNLELSNRNRDLQEIFDVKV